MILLQAYLYTYSLLRGVIFEVLILSSYALHLTMLSLLEIFLELLLWNSFQCRRHIISFCCLQCSEIFVRIRQTLFLETARSNLEPNKGNSVRVHFSNRFLGKKQLDKERLVSCSIVTVWRIQLLRQSSGIFLRTASRNSFNIST